MAEPSESDLTREQVNAMIHSYLRETGLNTTAFNFRNEARLDQNPIDSSLVPPANLVKLVQAGLQQLEVEANDCNVDDANKEFILFDPLDIMTKDEAELEKIVKEKTKTEQKGKEKVSKAVEPVPRWKDTEKTDVEKSGKQKGTEKLSKAVEPVPRWKDSEKTDPQKCIEHLRKLDCMVKDRAQQAKIVKAKTEIAGKTDLDKGFKHSQKLDIMKKDKLELEKNVKKKTNFEVRSMGTMVTQARREGIDDFGDDYTEGDDWKKHDSVGRKKGERESKKG